MAVGNQWSLFRNRPREPFLMVGKWVQMKLCCKALFFSILPRTMLIQHQIGIKYFRVVKIVHWFQDFCVARNARRICAAATARCEHAICAQLSLTWNYDIWKLCPLHLLLCALKYDYRSLLGRWCVYVSAVDAAYGIQCAVHTVHTLTIGGKRVRGRKRPTERLCCGRWKLLFSFVIIKWKLIRFVWPVLRSHSHSLPFSLPSIGSLFRVNWWQS